MILALQLIRELELEQALGRERERQLGQEWLRPERIWLQVARSHELAEYAALCC